MVKLVREVEKALGEVFYDLTEKMKKSREFSRSLFRAKDIRDGEPLLKKYCSMRAGYGLDALFFKGYYREKAIRNITVRDAT